MAVFYRNRYAWRRAARLATFVMVFTSALAVVARAQNPQPPYALFQYSTLTGSGNTITATRIPVVTTPGTTIYMNMTLQFDVDANGNLTISSGYPQFVPAPTLQVSSFMAGRYVGPSAIYSGGLTITVSGPGIADGGATEWSLAATSDAHPGTYPTSASWYVGPLPSNPLAARLKSAGITSTAWSYGVGSAQFTINGGRWNTNTLLGVSQIGNTLTIVSFTDGNGKDYALPQDQITYTLVP